MNTRVSSTQIYTHLHKFQLIKRNFHAINFIYLFTFTIFVKILFYGVSDTFLTLQIFFYLIFIYLFLHISLLSFWKVLYGLLQPCFKEVQISFWYNSVFLNFTLCIYPYTFLFCLFRQLSIDFLNIVLRRCRYFVSNQFIWLIHMNSN